MSRYVSIDELAAINPDVLRTMLLVNGWREINVRPELFWVLESPNEEADASIPISRSFRDYPARLNEALIEVEKYFGERARPFMLQLLAGPTDELFFAEEAPTVRGSIPWRIGEQLHDTAREALRAAAKSSGDHLPHFGHKGAGLAQRYIDGIRMGQTEHGSYIITALVPVGQQTDPTMQTLPGFENVPEFGDFFYRNVTANLMQASEAAVEAAGAFNETESFETFVEAVDYGVSSELVQALAKLAKGGEAAEISAQWSPWTPEPEGTPRRVEIRPDHVAAFNIAAIRFKEQTSVTTVTVRGIVTGLDRPRFGQDGISALDVLSGTQARRLRVRLSRDQYDEAIEAHREGSVLQVTGEQSRAGNFFWLYNARDIRLVPGPRQLDLIIVPDEDLINPDVEPDE
jgi:hypothetical protein